MISTTAANLAVASSAPFQASGGVCTVAGVTGNVTYTGTSAGTLLNCTIASGSYTAPTAAR